MVFFYNWQIRLSSPWCDTTRRLRELWPRILPFSLRVFLANDFQIILIYFPLTWQVSFREYSQRGNYILSTISTWSFKVTDSLCPRTATLQQKLWPYRQFRIIVVDDNSIRWKTDLLFMRRIRYLYWYRRSSYRKFFSWHPGSLGDSSDILIRRTKYSQISFLLISKLTDLAEGYTAANKEVKIW